MTKRAHRKFTRRARDSYDTPPEAVAPLLPHLPFEETSFWEPCAGNGALVHAIMSQAPQMYCTAKTDIEPRSPHIARRDALDCFPGGPQMTITNPPWDRPTLHKMILHFSDARPTWLLFDADWCHTKQAAPYMPRLRKIVSVGRVSWMGNGVSGFDNCAWHLFDQPSKAPTLFFGRAA